MSKEPAKWLSSGRKLEDWRGLKHAMGRVAGEGKKRADEGKEHAKGPRSSGRQVESWRG